MSCSPQTPRPLTLEPQTPHPLQLEQMTSLDLSRSDVLNMDLETISAGLKDNVRCHPRVCGLRFRDGVFTLYRAPYPGPQRQGATPPQLVGFSIQGVGFSVWC